MMSDEEQNGEIDSEEDDTAPTEVGSTPNPGTPVKTNHGFRLYVTGITAKSSQLLVASFAKYGKVYEATIKRLGTDEGLAFITLDTEENAKLAMKSLNKTQLGGSTITVEPFKSTSTRLGESTPEGRDSSFRSRGRGGWGFRGGASYGGFSQRMDEQPYYSPGRGGYGGRGRWGGYGGGGYGGGGYGGGGYDGGEYSAGDYGGGEYSGGRSRGRGRRGRGRGSFY